MLLSGGTASLASIERTRVLIRVLLQVATVVLRPILDLVFNQLLAKLSEQTGEPFASEAPDLCLPLSQQVQRVCEQTVADAGNMMKVLTWLLDENLISTLLWNCQYSQLLTDTSLAPYNYWDCNHTFSSAVTMLMAELMESIVNVSRLRPNPLFSTNKEATRTALDRATKLLEFQEELGNVPAAECMQLLRNLRIKVDGFLQVLQTTHNVAQQKSPGEYGSGSQLGITGVGSVQSSSSPEHSQEPLLIQLSDGPHRLNSFTTTTSAALRYDGDITESPLSSALVNTSHRNIEADVYPLDFTSALWDNHVSHYGIWSEFENPLVDE